MSTWERKNYEIPDACIVAAEREIIWTVGGHEIYVDLDTFLMSMKKICVGWHTFLHNTNTQKEHQWPIHHPDKD